MRRKTNEEFIEEMKIKNPSIIPLEVYKGRGKHIKCKCAKCGNIWRATPRNLLNGTKCNKCANLKRGRRTVRTAESFEKEAKIKAPNIILFGKYKKMKEGIYVATKYVGMNGRLDQIIY